MAREILTEVTLETLTVDQLTDALEHGGYEHRVVTEAAFIGYAVRGVARYTTDVGTIFVEHVPGVGFVGGF